MVILLTTMIIKFMVKQPRPLSSRPADFMQVLDISTQLIGFSTCGLLTLAASSNNKSINNLFGDYGCRLLGLAQTVHGWKRILGGFGVSTFRYVLMTKADLVQNRRGMNKLMNIILLAEGGVLALVILGDAFGHEMRPFLTKRCSGEVHEKVTRLLNTFTLIKLVAKFSIYVIEVVLNFQLYQSLRAKKKLMGKSGMKAKLSTTKSITNLESHLRGFVIDLAFNICILTLNVLKLLTAYQSNMLWSLSTIVASLVTILTSPGMRNRYLVPT